MVSNYVVVIFQTYIQLTTYLTLRGRHLYRSTQDLDPRPLRECSVLNGQAVGQLQGETAARRIHITNYQISEITFDITYIPY